MCGSCFSLLHLCCSRSEGPKGPMPASSTRGGGGGGLELQLNTACRQTQRCWSESQRDRCSPTGGAVTTPDTGETQNQMRMFLKCRNGIYLPLVQNRSIDLLVL